MKKIILKTKFAGFLLLALNLLFAGGIFGQTVITSGNTVAASAITAGNSITINAGGTLNMDVAKSFTSITANNSGTSTISGSNLLTVTGAVTIETGNTLSLNPNCNAASVTNSYTSTTPATISGSGILTVSGAFTVVSGTIAAPSADGTFAIDVNSTLICTSIVRGGGTRNHNITVSGTLKNSGVTGVINVFTCNTGSTVEYNGAAQTVHINIYYNLVLSGSGVKTITSVATINGDFILSGTVSATSASAKAIGGNLTIGSGTSFTVSAGVLSIGGNLTIGSGATFNAGTSLTHNVGGDWTNDGAFSFTTASTINFNGSNALQQIKGGSVTAFGNITVNKGTATSNILEATVPFTMATAAATNTLKLTNGTFKVSSASTFTPFGGTNTILGTTTGFYLNNASAVSNWGSAGSPTVKGELTIAAGTMNIGTGPDVLTIGTGAIYIQSGGILNLNGRLMATQAGASFTMSNGNFNIVAGGTVNTSAASIFQVGTLFTPFSITGGTVTIASANANTAKPDISIVSSGTPITGGTFVVSDATITVNNNVPFYNFQVQNGAGTGSAKLVTLGLQVTNDITIASGTLDDGNNVAINVGGNWTNNSGTYTPGTGIVTFNNTASDQNITGTSSTQTFYKITLAKSSTKLNISGSTTKLTVTNTLTMITGNIDCGSNTLELGTSTASVGTLSYTAGNIIGNFKRWISATGTGIVFPVGTASDNRKGLVTFVNLTPGSLTAKFIASDPGSTGLPLGESSFTILNQFTEGYWSFIAADALASTNYALELTGTNFTSYTEDANVRIMKRSTGGSWTLSGTHVAGSAPTAKRSALSGFGEFGHGKALPCLTGAGAPTPSSQTICQNGTGNITVSATGGTAPFSYQWFSNAINSNSGGINLGSANGAQTATYTAQPGSPGTNYYYAVVSQTGSTCGSFTSVTASVTRTAIPTATISYSGNPFCQTDATVHSVSLSGTGAYTGGTYSSFPLGLTLNGTNGNVTPLGSTAGAYTVTYTIPASGGCSAVPVTTSVTITPLPVATFSYTGTPYCSSGTNPLPSFSGGGVAGVFSSTTGLVFVSTATGEVNLSTSTAGTYTVTNTIAAAGGCAQVTANSGITITALPTAMISYSGNPFCETDATVHSVSLSGTGAYTGGTYSSFPSGLTLNGTSGDVTPLGSTAGVYTVTYTIPASGGCSTVPVTTSVTITALPVATFSYTGNPYCNTGSNPFPTFSGGGVAGVFSSTPGLVFVNTATGQVDLAASTIGTYTVTNTIAASTCAQVTANNTITIDSFRVDTIVGPTNACPYTAPIGDTATYSVSTSMASGYTWTAPAHATILTGNGTNTITVVYDLSFVSGTISVTVTSTCAAPITRNLSITQIPPAKPGPITGPMDACSYVKDQTTATYTIPALPDVVFYEWTLPAFVTYVSGQGTTSITVKFDTGYVAAPFLVKSVSGCAFSADTVLTVPIVAPVLPGPISGPVNACFYIDTTWQATYTINKIPLTETYIWTVPTGATITSHPGGAGINDTIITVAYDNTFVTSTNISVQSSSVCGTSSKKNLTILRSVARLPGLISGPTNACPLMISGTNPTGTPATYTIASVSTATSYDWTVPAGATINSHPGGLGINDTSIIVTYDGSFISGSITVDSRNGCGPSAARTLAISRSLPAAPSAITGPINACPLMISATNPTGTQATYTIHPSANATDYSWDVPFGANIDSHPNGSGVNDTIILVTYSGSFTSGNVIVIANNNCSSSSTRSLAISRTIPATPGTITGPTDPCPWIGTSGATYTIRKVVNATGYTWTVPGTGASISSHPGGAGVNDTIIIVNYTSAFTTGSVTVTADVNCGSSAAKSLALTRKLPSTPGTITSSVLAGCPNRRYLYSVAALPANANYISWTVPGGGTIDSTANGTLYAYVSYTGGAISGSVTASGTNNCASGTARSLVVNLSACGPFAPPVVPASPSFTNQPPVKQSIDRMEVKLMPNPTINDFKLQVSTSAKEEIYVKLVDIAGKELQQFTLMPYQVISFGNQLKAGTYFIRISQGKNVTTQKLLKF